MFLEKPLFLAILRYLLVVLTIFSNSNKRTFKNTSTVDVTTVNNVTHNLSILKFDELVFNNLRHLTSLLLSFFTHKKFKSFSSSILSRFFLPQLQDSSHLFIREFRNRSRFNRPVLITICREQKIRKTRVNRTNLSSSKSNKSLCSELIHSSKNSRRVHTLILTKIFYPFIFNLLTSSNRLIKTILNISGDT